MPSTPAAAASSSFSGVWTPEAVIAVVAVLVAIVLWSLDRWWRRSRVTYRVHLDTPVDVTPEGADLFELEVLRAGNPVQDASIVLIRVRNQGSTDIAATAFAVPLTFTFPGRTVLSAAVPETTPPVLKDVIARVPMELDGPRLALPPVPLNRGNRVKLLVLLSGTGSGVNAESFIEGGRFTQDSGRIPPSYRTLGLGAVVLLLVGALAGSLIRSATAEPELCRSGELQIVGSTAFAPVMKDVVGRYRDDCPDATISIDARGSRAGLETLHSTGKALKSVQENQLAMSDVPSQQPELHGREVGTLVFALIVNQAAGVSDLSTAQVRDVWSGRYRSWSDLGGKDVPIVLAGRDADSGTRAVFEQKILGGDDGFAVTSADCRRYQTGADDDDPLRCELSSTDDVLQTVNTVPGALGYVQLSEVGDFPAVRPLRLGGASADSIASPAAGGGYPFWSQEYLYTYGIPSGDGLLAAFLDFTTTEYLPTEQARRRFLANGFVPPDTDPAP
jgi:phosphate transport system substrate-binding protein